MYDIAHRYFIKKLCVIITGVGSGAADAGKGGPPGAGGAGGGGGVQGKYVAPFLRDGARRDAAGSGPMRRDDTAAIRISNLSDSTVEADLEDLVKAFGPVQKLYLAKEKVHNLFLWLNITWA